MFSTTTFEKRLGLMEVHLKQFQDVADKRFDTQKEALEKTKEQLEDRVDSIMCFEDKLTILSDDLAKVKRMVDEN